MGEGLEKVKMAVAKVFLDTAFPEGSIGMEDHGRVRQWMREIGWDIAIYHSDEDDGMIVSFLEPHTADKFFIHYGGFDASIITVLNEGITEEI